MIADIIHAIMVYLLAYMHLRNQPDVAKWTIHGWYAQCYVYTLGPCSDIYFLPMRTMELLFCYPETGCIFIKFADGFGGKPFFAHFFRDIDIPKEFTNHHVLASQDAKTPSTWWKSGWVFRVQKCKSTAMAIRANWCNWWMHPGICTVYIYTTYAAYPPRWFL